MRNSQLCPTASGLRNFNDFLRSQFYVNELMSVKLHSWKTNLVKLFHKEFLNANIANFFHHFKLNLPIKCVALKFNALYP